MTRSSLVLEVLLYLHSYYFAAFILLELCFGVFKVMYLPYQKNSLIMESLILVFLSVIELIRIYLGRKGNLTQTLLPLIVSTILAGPSVLASLYLLLWQTYVLWLELVFCYIQIVMQGMEIVISLVSIVTFYKYSSY